MIRTITLSFILLPIGGFCQKEANVWLFDKSLGIDFNDGLFRSFNMSVNLDQEGATASICDKNTGKLLFFTNGRDIWNRTFSKMPNGWGLKSGKNTSQAVLIVPVPQSNDQYYVFTTKSINDPYPEGETGLYYSTVDMSLNNGLGNVISASKNVPILYNASDKLIAIPHSNERDYWLITHEGDSDRFVVFPISSDGIGIPLYFGFGPVYDYFKSRGWLQASPNGKMLLCAVSSDGFEKNPLELYDFDASAGTIKERRELGLYPELTGVSFSPDNSKIYFTYSDQLDNARGSLCQMDLAFGTGSETIKQTLTNLYALHDPLPESSNTRYDTIRDGVLQLAPDGRLYLKAIAPYFVQSAGNEAERRKIYFVDKPNLPGFLCIPKGRDFNGSFPTPNGWSFPNTLPHYFNGIEPVENGNSNSDCEDLQILVYPNPTDSFVDIRFVTFCNQSLELKLLNSLGQLISFDTIHEPFYSVDLSGYSSGLYLLVIHQPESSNPIVIKVIKK
jgi:Secretion system C-terminal sorting domain